MFIEDTKPSDKQKLRRDRAVFDTYLMRLKSLDEHNKMIPYFEKKAQEWDEKKAGVFEKIAKVLKIISSITVKANRLIIKWLAFVFGKHS